MREKRHLSLGGDIWEFWEIEFKRIWYKNMKKSKLFKLDKFICENV